MSLQLNFAFLFLNSVYNEQSREYFGLRDFYSLIKMVFSMVKETRADPTEDQLVTAVQRNFGGYFGDFDPTDKFLGEIGLTINNVQKTGKWLGQTPYFCYARLRRNILQANRILIWIVFYANLYSCLNMQVRMSSFCPPLSRRSALSHTMDQPSPDIFCSWPRTMQLWELFRSKTSFGDLKLASCLDPASGWTRNTLKSAAISTKSSSQWNLDTLSSCVIWTISTKVCMMLWTKTTSCWVSCWNNLYLIHYSIMHICQK